VVQDLRLRTIAHMEVKGMFWVRVAEGPEQQTLTRDARHHPRRCLPWRCT